MSEILLGELPLHSDVEEQINKRLGECKSNSKEARDRES